MTERRASDRWSAAETVRGYRATPTRRFAPRFRLEPAIQRDLEGIRRADQEIGVLESGGGHQIYEDTLERNACAIADELGEPVNDDKVRSLVAGRPRLPREAPPEARIIVNHATFIDELHAHRLPRTPEEVRLLHRTLFRGVLSDAGSYGPAADPATGRWRALGDTEEQMEALLEWLHDDSTDAVVRSAVFLHAFNRLRPFSAGNERLGRALYELSLYHNGYPGMRYTLIDERLAETGSERRWAEEAVGREGEYTIWIRYLVGIQRRAYDEAVRRFLLRRGIQGRMHERQWRIAEWFARVEREKPGHRVRFAEVQAAFPQIAERTLQRDLARLRDNGILVMHGKWKGARYRFVGG